MEGKSRFFFSLIALSSICCFFSSLTVSLYLSLLPSIFPTLPSVGLGQPELGEWEPVIRPILIFLPSSSFPFNHILTLPLFSLLSQLTSEHSFFRMSPTRVSLALFPLVHSLSPSHSLAAFDVFGLLSYPSFSSFLPSFSARLPSPALPLPVSHCLLLFSSILPSSEARLTKNVVPRPTAPPSSCSPSPREQAGPTYLRRIKAVILESPEKKLSLREVRSFSSCLSPLLPTKRNVRTSD